MLAYLKRIIGAGRLPESLSYERARAVLESHKAKLENELAGRADAEPEMLYYLAERGDAASRRAVAANASAPSQANWLLAGDTDWEVRAELARKVGRLLPDLLASEREIVCRQTLDTLHKLAKDQLPRVRAILAEEIKRLDCVPPAIVAKLARDAEEMVAVPILEYSPLLSDGDLLEIIAGAKAQFALAAIARRRGLDEKISDAIVATLDIPAVAALLANPDAHIREDTMEDIVEKAESIASWHGPLTMRTDLSVRVLRRIAGFVGSALLEKLVSRYGLDDEIGTYLKRTLRTRLETDEFQSNDAADKAQYAARSAMRGGALDEVYVESAVEAGDRELVIESLALLAKTGRETIDNVFSSRSAKAITALAWHAGLTMRIAFKIQTIIVKLRATELLPARQGVHYPLSEEEMRWHLSYFGLTEGGSPPA